MKATILLLLFPLYATGQIDKYGEQLWIQEISADAITIRGEHFGIDSGPEMEFRWEVRKDGRLYGIYLGEEDNPFLKVALPSGNYQIVRYTYYYTNNALTGITESERLELICGQEQPLNDLFDQPSPALLQPGLPLAFLP